MADFTVTPASGITYIVVNIISGVNWKVTSFVPVYVYPFSVTAAE